MYNSGMPSAFKAFVDHIVSGGRTYVLGPDQTIIGELAGKRAVFATAGGANLGAGTDHASADALTPGLRAAFALIDLTRIEFVDAQPIQFACEARQQQALAQARAELDRVAERWITKARTGAPA